MHNGKLVRYNKSPFPLGKGGTSCYTRRGGMGDNATVGRIVYGRAESPPLRTL